MAQPKHVRPEVLSDNLRELAQQLASLSRGEREAVLMAVGALANDAGAALPHASWNSIDSAKEIVSWGGDALEDSEAIYDG